jgi:hypothetical protein
MVRQFRDYTYNFLLPSQFHLNYSLNRSRHFFQAYERLDKSTNWCFPSEVEMQERVAVTVEKTTSMAERDTFLSQIKLSGRLNYRVRAKLKIHVQIRAPMSYGLINAGERVSSARMGTFWWYLQRRTSWHWYHYFHSKPGVEHYTYTILFHVVPFSAVCSRIGVCITL